MGRIELTHLRRGELLLRLPVIIKLFKGTSDTLIFFEVLLAGIKDSLQLSIDLEFYSKVIQAEKQYASELKGIDYKDR